MKIRHILSLIAAVTLFSSCFGIDDENYPELAPIEIRTASDTLNVTQGVAFTYTGLTVESSKDVKYEWCYGPFAQGTAASAHKFQSYEVISDSKTIDYTFNTLGTFLLRLKADNGESVQYHYFTLNVNFGFDEGIVILNNDAEGNGKLSFVKTLTEEEIAAGVQDFHEDIFGPSFPEYTLKNGTALKMTNQLVKKVQTAGLLVATNDGRGTIYEIEPMTFEMYNVARMEEQGTYCKEFGGENANTGYLVSFFIGADGKAYSFDYQVGYVTNQNDVIPEDMERCVTLTNRSSATSATTQSGVFFSDKGLYMKENTSYASYTADGYKVINIACKRTGLNSSAAYFMEQSLTDPSSYRIMGTSAKRISTPKVISTFTSDGICMDSSSKFVETLSANDVYYTWNNAIYRWPLSSKPASTPAIKLPEGEQIKDIATNYKGKDKGTEGEDLLYVVTYNPDRAGDKKGSLYIYRFSDETCIKSYEGAFYNPVSVIYKYRLSN